MEWGHSDGIEFAHGKLNIGETMAPPVIRKVKEKASNNGVVIVDAPPGTSCPVIESVRGADYVLLVTEPTPFGLHDLKLAVEMVRALRMPFGVVINRADMGDNETMTYCRANRIDVVAEIPDDRRIAEAYSRGELACEAVPSCLQIFKDLLTQLAGLTTASRSLTTSRRRGTQ